MEDPAVLLARPDLDLVGLRVEQDDRVLVVDAGRKKIEFIVDANFLATKATFNDSRKPGQHVMAFSVALHYEATARL